MTPSHNTSSHLSSGPQLFLRHSGVRYPIICGAMYPCSNPELVAAVSQAGGLGIIQPIALTYVHGYSFTAGLDYLQSLASAPLGMNVIVEKSARMYERTMRKWVEQALEAGIRFFVTSLGNPRWVVEMVHAAEGKVYHDVTTKRWALKAQDAGVDGLIAVGNKAGGHAGDSDLSYLLSQLSTLQLPIIAAGGIATGKQVRECLSLGYAGVQLGTRFIASEECTAHADYKEAIIQARQQDIVHTRRISGVPVAVINTPYVGQVGTEVSWLGARMLRHPRAKHWIRTFWALRSLRSLSRSLSKEQGYQGYWQAGKSVEHIGEIMPAEDIIQELARHLEPHHKL